MRRLHIHSFTFQIAMFGREQQLPAIPGDVGGPKGPPRAPLALRAAAATSLVAGVAVTATLAIKFLETATLR